MAMSRSLGGRSLTTAPPIRIVPALTSSSPAIIRSKVDFPQPDGPTSTMNSPSAMARSMPCRTLTAPKDLLTPVMSIDAMAIPSALHRAGGEPPHEIFLDQDEEQEGGDERDHPRRHHLAEIHRELADEGEEADGKRALVGLGDQ